MASPDDVAALEKDLDPTAQYVVNLLRQSLEELKGMLAERDAQIAQLTEQIATFQRMLFGKRSEKLPPIESEVRRVIERHELTVDGEPMPTEQAQVDHQRRHHARQKSIPQRKRKRALPNDLPVITERVDVLPVDLQEGSARSAFEKSAIAKSLSASSTSASTSLSSSITCRRSPRRTATCSLRRRLPAGLVECGHYGPGLYAHVITPKCADSLPLHRIESVLERAGCPIARSPLCDLFHRSAELLEPIYRRLLDVAKHDPYLHDDETTLRVQQRGGCLNG